MTRPRLKKLCGVWNSAHTIYKKKQKFYLGAVGITTKHYSVAKLLGQTFRNGIYSISKCLEFEHKIQNVLYQGT